MYEFPRVIYGKGSPAKLATLFARCNPAELTRRLTQDDVLPFFYNNLVNGRVALDLPAQILKQWKVVAGQISLHNTVYQEEYVTLSEALRAQGLRCVMLKGFTHADKLYGDLWQRPARDLDLLVSPEDYPRVKSYLLANGFDYSVTDDSGTPLPPHSLPLWERLLKEMHFSKAHGGYEVNIDVHWDLASLWLAPVRAIYPLNLFPWFESTERMPLGDTSIECLIPELHFCQCVYHFALNNHFTGLKWFLDLCQYVFNLADQLDWDLIYRFAPTDACRKVFWVTLNLVFQVTGRSFHAGLDRFVRRVERRVPDWELELYRSRLFARKSILNKHLCSALLPCRFKDRLRVALFMLFDPGPMQLWDASRSTPFRALQPAHIVYRILRSRSRSGLARPSSEGWMMSHQ